MNYQQEEARKNEIREQSAEHKREVRELEGKLEECKRLQRETDDKFYHLIVVQHGLLLEDTQRHLEELERMEKQKQERAISYNRRLLSARENMEKEKMDAIRYRLKILEQKKGSEQKDELKNSVAQLKSDSAAIGRMIARLQFLISKNVSEVITYQIGKLKTNLAVFHVRSESLKKNHNAKLLSLICESVLDTSYKLEEMNTEFELKDPVNAARNIGQIQSNWSNVSRIVETL